MQKLWSIAFRYDTPRYQECVFDYTDFAVEKANGTYPNPTKVHYRYMILYSIHSVSRSQM